jgi:serine/threonine-protein kinase HipA
MDLALAQSVAPYFRITEKEADEVIERSRAVVTQWRKLANQLGISAREQERMTPAFRLAE